MEDNGARLDIDDISIEDFKKAIAKEIKEQFDYSTSTDRVVENPYANVRIIIDVMKAIEDKKDLYVKLLDNIYPTSKWGSGCELVYNSYGVGIRHIGKEITFRVLTWFNYGKTWALTKEELE